MLDFVPNIKCPVGDRPWGSFSILKEFAAKNSLKVKIKQIVVNPGAKLSLQRHLHRAEHWIVLSGTALINNESDKFELHKGQSTYIPEGNKHRLENPGKIPLEILEVQIGEYVGEDDIERLNDVYGRCKQRNI